MSHRSRRRAALSACIALAFLVATGCGGKTENVDFTGRIVDPPFKVASDVLTSTTGATVNLGLPSDANRLRLVFFGYTHCRDICPAVLASLAAGLAKLSAADRASTQTYFVTTDPKRDTSRTLRAYLSHFDPTFVGLYGPLQDAARIGRSVGVYVDEGKELESGGYDPNSHGVYVVGIDAGGQAPVFWNGETSPSQFASDIKFMLHEG